MKSHLTMGLVLLASSALLATEETAAAPETRSPAPEPVPPGEAASDDAPQTPREQASPTSPTVPAMPVPASPRFEQTLDVQGGLTAEQAALRAAASSTQARVKQAEYRAADAQVAKTFYSLAPRLTLTARYTRLSPVTVPSLGGGGSLVGTTAAPGLLPPGATLVAIDGSAFSFPVILNQYFLNAGLVVPLSDYLLTTSQAVRGAHAVRDGAALDERAARVTDAANAKLTYYSWVRSKLQAALARQNVEQAEQRLKHTERLLQGGRVAEADVLQARAFLADSKLVAERARTLVNVSEEQLRLAMHAPPDERFEIGENVLGPFTEDTEAADLEELYREAVVQRLELRVLEKTEYSLAEGSSAQAAGAYPRLEAFGNVTYANPNQRIFPQSERWDATWDVGVQMIWTLNDLGTASSDSRQTEAQREQIIAQKSALKDALRVEILNAKQALEEARLSVTTAEQGQRAAEAAYTARKALYDYGRATNLELLQAETARFRARLQVIEAHIGLRTARVQLDHALGRDVDAIK